MAFPLAADDPRVKQLIPEKQGQARDRQGNSMTFRGVLVNDQLTKGQLLTIAERAMADLIRDREIRAMDYDLKRELEDAARRVKAAEVAHDGPAEQIPTR